ncbi:MAG: phage major capsid protein [Clostridiales bacterium]|nr:phage major capsid protein [Clostridiales bacterium]
MLNGFALSPQAKGELLGAVDSTGRPLFVNSVADGVVPRLIGAPAHYAKAAYKDGTSGSGATPDVIGFAGDWTQALYGTVEGIKIDMSNQASLPIGASNAMISLWQNNMFAVRAEIEVGFRADTSVFQKITRTHA